MTKIVFDIETVGKDFGLLDEASQEYFLRFAGTEQEVEDAKNSLSFYPVTAEVVAVGMLEVESGKGCVFFQDTEKKKFQEGDVTFVTGDEKQILQDFWGEMKKYPQFVTFSGRIFDCPFLMLRSAMNHIPISRNLMPYRYSHAQHVDLADQLTFYDAVRRKFSLDMWCKAFGIRSPKQDGVTGLDVRNLFKEGRYEDIARYCLRDVQATKELYQYWEKYLRFNDRS
jgi:hypothetical protein